MGSILTAFARGIRRLGTPLFIAGTTVVLLIGAVAFALSRPRPAAPLTISYGALITGIHQGRADSIQIRPGADVRGWLRGSAGEAKQVRIIYPAADPAPLITAATAAGVGVSFLPRPADLGLIIGLVATLSVVLILAGVLRRQPGGGKVDTEAGSTGGTAVTFQDVAGNTGAIADLQEIVGFLKEPRRFAAMGARIPKGLLMEGPPGTGKTLMARALAGEAGVPCYVASGSDFTGTYVGQGVQRIKGLFRKARKAGGAVIFIDEIDTLGGRRGRENGHKEDDRILNQFLVAGWSPCTKPGMPWRGCSTAPPIRSTRSPSSPVAARWASPSSSPIMRAISRPGSTWRARPGRAVFAWYPDRGFLHQSAFLDPESAAARLGAAE